MWTWPKAREKNRPQKGLSEHPTLKQERNPEIWERKKHFKVKGWGSDQETRKWPKEHGEDYGAGTDTERAKGQSAGTKSKNILMDKRKGKGFMVRESSENKKQDKCKPAWLETEFILLVKHLIWFSPFILPRLPAQILRRGEHANVPTIHGRTCVDTFGKRAKHIGLPAHHGKGDASPVII